MPNGWQQLPFFYCQVSLQTKQLKHQCYPNPLCLLCQQALVWTPQVKALFLSYPELESCAVKLGKGHRRLPSPALFRFSLPHQQ